VPKERSLPRERLSLAPCRHFLPPNLATTAASDAAAVTATRMRVKGLRDVIVAPGQAAGVSTRGV